MSSKYKSEFLHVMTERGHINQCTDLEGLDAAMQKGIVTAYIGYDATADSLHVGSLATIMMLRRLQQCGHRPITLMGGGTTKVGDPSDKTGLRQMRTNEEIDSNIISLQTVFGSFLKYGNGPTDALLANNADWLDKLEYIPFLRDIGAHFTINRMITFDFVKRRLEQELPLTFLEFNYMIMQGYDFVELNRRYGCTMQMGGSDQWGNIVNGVELGRRMKDADFFGLTTPLIMTSSGVKMGKTVNGAVWLKPEKLSAYDYWQFWRNTEDADVGRFLRLFTDMPIDEIKRLEKLEGAEINEAKKILAFEATKLCRGEEAAKQAAETARQTFEGGGKGADLPVFELPSNGTATLIEALVKLNFCASNGEAKRLITQGGVKLNDQTVTDLAATLSAKDLDKAGTARLTAGKKRHAVVKIV